MFTGIIEAKGIIKKIYRTKNNVTFVIESELTPELKVDQSLAHNGICLTIEAVNNIEYSVTAIAETIQKTNIQNWQEGSIINLERCLQMNGRIDGHIVQGHVDTTLICTNKIDQNGSWEFEFELKNEDAALVIEKGSICINGISLTAFNVLKNSFKVAIIPYTYMHTNIHQLQIGERVNCEFDMIGKYLYRYKNLLTTQLQYI